MSNFHSIRSTTTMSVLLILLFIVSGPAATMAEIKVHGHPLSTNTRRVLVALHEKDLEFEFVQIELKNGEHKQESFISLNPFGQVPAFEDGDLKLFESRAITRYIVHEHSEKGTQLLGSDSKDMAMISVWLEVEAHQFDPLASKLLWEQMIKPMYGLSTDQSAIQENEAKLAKVLDVYETRLNQTKYLASDSYSLADLHHIPAVEFLLGTPSRTLFEERKKVNAWVSDITGRPAWRKAVQFKKLDHMQCE